MTKAQRLVEIMARLRDPEAGCPWDLEQSFETIAPYTLEEAYEVDQAIRQADMEGLREELGDLLLQVVFHAQMAREAGHFDFDDVVDGICEKLIRRHPHVFGDAVVESAEEQTRLWEEAKVRERARRADSLGLEVDPFEGLPVALPSLTRAVKLGKRIAREGGPDPDVPELHGRAELALARLGQRLAEGEVTDAAVSGEVGELLAAAAGLARGLGVDPERALGDCNRAFEEAFRDQLRRRAAGGASDSREDEAEDEAPVE
jgi:ATP diphosphatase